MSIRVMVMVVVVVRFGRVVGNLRAFWEVVEGTLGAGEILVMRNSRGTLE